MLLAGAACLFLPRHWFIEVSLPQKMLVYSGIAVPCAFLLFFLFADCINYVSLNCYAGSINPVVGTVPQIWALTGMAIFVGLLYGTIFALVDSPSAHQYLLALVGMRDESYAVSIGVILGAIAGFLNDVLGEVDKSSGEEPKAEDKHCIDNGL